ncbi:hypothetical protein Tco_1341461 [Tanacetum coccineum]
MCRRLFPTNENQCRIHAPCRCTMWNRKFPIPLHSCSTGRGTGAMKVFKTGEAHLQHFREVGVFSLQFAGLNFGVKLSCWQTNNARTNEDFPPSSLPLLDCLISIDPDDCGSATASLNSAMRLKLDIAYVYMVSIFSVSFILCCDAL